MPAVWDGKELKQISVADFNARNMPSANTGGGMSSAQAVSPVTGAPAQAQKTSGGGIKGGRDPIDPSKVKSSQYNTDENYGYYNDQGKYVSAWQDRIDGGGRNQSGNYFVGGGLFSSLLNALKIRPSGAARERDDQGNYVVDRADIGYRDFKDMYDRGGPQASGGRFEGLGLYSDFANLLFGEKGQRTPYADQTAAAAQAVKDLQNPTPVRTGPSPSYATMDVGEVGRGANVGLQNIPPAYGYGGNRPMVNPLANMPATQYMQQVAGTPPSGLLSGMMAAQGATEPDFVAGSQNQQAYRDALAAMQGRMDISKMPMEQIQEYMRLYRQGGPRR